MARKSNFSEKEIIDAIHEVEAGTTQADVARKMGVSPCVREVVASADLLIAET